MIALFMVVDSWAGVQFTVKNLVPIVDSSTRQLNALKPQWSPDGRFLSFETSSEHNHGLWVYDLETGQITELISKKAVSGTHDAPSSSFLSMGAERAVANHTATWSADSQRIAYVGSGSAGHWGLYYAVRPDWQSFTLFVGGSPDDPHVHTPKYYPGKRRNGRAIKGGEDVVVFCRGTQEESGGSDLYWAASQPPDVSRSAHGNRLVLFGGLENVLQMEPTFSPDGRRMLFSGSREGNSDIWTVGVTVRPRLRDFIAQPESGHAVPLFEWDSAEIRPAWSPDGRIAFLSSRDEEKKEWGLWVIGAAGENPKKLARRVLEEDLPEWYDDKYLFYIQLLEEERNPIRYVDTHAVGNITDAMEDYTTLFTDTVLHEYLAISPDRTKIAICARGKTGDSNLTWLKLYVGDLLQRE